MAAIEGGQSLLVADVGLAAAMGLHTVNKPAAHGNQGHYRLAAKTGTIAAALAADAQLFTWRWSDISRLCIVTRVKAQFQALTPFTAATLTDFGFNLHKVTSVSAGGGGTAITAFSKMRSTMATSLLAASGTDVRIATTAALTSLTTIDANPLAASIGDCQRVNPAAGTEEVVPNVPILDFAPDIASGESPLVLSTLEGFCISNRTVWPVAGTGILLVEVAWLEATLY